MSELEGTAEQGRVRQCEWCQRNFLARKHNQMFCKRRCQSRSAKARKHQRTGLMDQRPAPILPSRVLFELQAHRERIHLPRLEVLPYLELRAGILEAEEQLRRWAERLADRRARIAVLDEPPLSREVHLLLGDQDLLVVAPRAAAIGIVSLDGLLGVAVVGFPR